ncbi:hypothetical protein Tsubulata_033011 [Turnera subulata]|uniref:Uncharacterized protein n=1 Tax=Turnera subulata TaxID=218843 RepID=A0A9Q0JBA5_9ROSI|nr:hypothetical protein Tsubulata_033011 [Turnera subulata]
MSEPTTTLKSPLTNLPPPSLDFPPKPPLKLLHLTNFPSKPNNFKTLCSHSPPPPPPPPPPNPPETQTLISLLRVIPDWVDRVKERGMRKNRSLYTHEKWVEHRSSLRHVRHVLSSLSSRVVLSLVPPVIAFTSVAVVIACYNSSVEMHFLPELFPVLRASSLPYQLTAPALALLLVFRTEASYSRFVEGRKAWTKVISRTNDFARQVIAGVDGSSNSALKKQLLRYIMAFPFALKCHVIYGSDIGRDLRNLLEVEDLAVVLNSRHRPRCIIEFISQCLKLLNLEESMRNILVGVLIEEPFPMLALDELCSHVRSNIEEAIASEKVIHAQLLAKRNKDTCEHSTNGWPNS